MNNFEFSTSANKLTVKCWAMNWIQASIQPTYSYGSVNRATLLHMAFSTGLRCSDGGAHTVAHNPRVRSNACNGIPSSVHCPIIEMNCNVRSATKVGLKLDIIVLRINELNKKKNYSLPTWYYLNLIKTCCCSLCIWTGALPGHFRESASPRFPW